MDTHESSTESDRNLTYWSSSAHILIDIQHLYIVTDHQVKLQYNDGRYVTIDTVECYCI